MSLLAQADSCEPAGRPSIDTERKTTLRPSTFLSCLCVVDLVPPVSAKFRSIRDASFGYIATERDASLWSLPYRSSIHDIPQEIHHKSQATDSLAEVLRPQRDSSRRIAAQRWGSVKPDTRLGGADAPHSVSLSESF